MKRRMPQLCVLALLTGAALSHAREWRSSDGTRNFEAEFVRVDGVKIVLKSNGSLLPYALSAFSAADQEFARNAQSIADTALKWGPQSFEISHRAEQGWLCRLALGGGGKGAPVLYTGEMFFLVSANPPEGEPGDRFQARLLYGAGGRTFHPLKGAPSPIRAFALSAEEATRVWSETVARSGGDLAKQSPPVLEPDLEIVTLRSLGITVGKSGLVMTDAGITTDAASIVVHLNGDALPATLVQTDDALGVAIVSCKAPCAEARIGARKPPVPGQNVFAVSVEMNARKLGLLTSPMMTRGIVSRPADARTGRFLHDARVPPESPGGFIVGEKGDVLGVFFQSQASARSASAKAAVPRGEGDGLGGAVSTQTLSALLEKVPGAGAPRLGSGGGMIEKAGAELMPWAVLVVATREISKPRKKPAEEMGPTTTPGAAATGWSLSKSGTRHNARCRFYNAAMPCAASDGKPCKTCGG